MDKKEGVGDCVSYLFGSHGNIPTRLKRLTVWGCERRRRGAMCMSLEELGRPIGVCVCACVSPLLTDLTGTKLCIRQRYNENHSNEISIFSSRGAPGRPRELTCESDYN